ncbi:MAG: glycosyltransferase family 1 protein [Ferruginibacter sp.]
MKIVVNCWLLRNKSIDGIGYFTINTIQRIARNNPADSFILLCDKNFTEHYFDLPNVTIERIFPPYRHPLLYIFYMEMVVPGLLRKHMPDLFLAVEGILSLSSSCKQLAVIHDLNFEHHPKNLALKNRLYYRFFYNRFAKKASRIATVSEYSKTDISSLYKIPADKIDNVLSGINSSLRISSAEEKNAARKKYSNGLPYFFFVGSVNPRKNMLRLLQAFDQFKKTTNSNFKMVITGAVVLKKSDILKACENSPYKNDILFTGRLTEEELQKVFGGAYALTFVPVFEGFGLPIVEAFEAGIPVLASNVTSLPEVAGDAAIYADPFDVDSITEAMVKLYENNDGLCNDLIQKGYQRKQLFSWDKTAALLWDSMQKAIDNI